ncbi:MAG: sugar ABC transporter substrate-binding protein, partial [Treponema sp.]|nr:sugar ABC transporter substrate-binding protein [Treponema sp.]
MKKLIALSLMALSIASFAFAAPAKKAKAKKGKKLEISIFTIQQRQQPPKDNKAYKWIEDTFGVTFKFDILVGDKEQKKGILISDPKHLPDLVEIDDTRFIDAGLLWPLEEWIEKDCPNLLKHYKTNNPTNWIKMTEPDGHIYCLPNYGVYDGPDQGTFYNGNAFWIQKEVLKEFGYPT